MQATTVTVRDDERDLTILLASLLVAEVGQGNRDVSLDFRRPGCGTGGTVSENRAIAEFGEPGAPRSMAARREKGEMVS